MDQPKAVLADDLFWKGTSADETTDVETADVTARRLELLLDNFKEAVRGVEHNTLAAFIFAALLLIPGLEGAFTLEAIAREERKLSLPLLNLEAQLFTAVLFCLVLYVVFCLRGAHRMKQARAIAAEISAIDRRILEAVVFYPCIATSSRRSKLLFCVALGLLGGTAWLLMYYPTRGWGTPIMGVWVMLLPPGYLFLVLRRPIGGR